MDQLITNIIAFFQTFYSFPFIFEILCVSISTLLIHGDFSKKPKKIFISILEFFLLYVSITFLSMMSYAMNQPKYTPTLIILSMVIPCVIYLGIKDSLSFKKKFVRMTLFFSATYVITEIGHHNNLILSKLTLNHITNEILMSLPYLLILVSGFIIGYININRFYMIPTSYLILDTSVFLAILALSMIQSRFTLSDSIDYNVFVIFVHLVLLGIDLGIYVFLYLLLKSQENAIKAEAEAKINQSALIMLKMNQDSIARASMARHDIKNHYAYALNLLREKKYDKAEEYLRKTSNSNFEDIHIIDCGNSVVSAILNLEMTKAHLENIEMMTMIAVPPILPFQDNDLCSLLTNLIDNALEETSRTTGKCSRIDVRIKADRNYLRMLVVNPTEKTSPEFISSKKTEGHGYGIGIIKGIMDKYNGHITFYIENGRFYADGMMEMVSKNKEIDHDQNRNTR